MLGIIYNGVHSYDKFHLSLKSKNIGQPAQNIITVQVPYLNGSYDFSNLYGNRTYQDRILTYVFEFGAKTKAELNVKKIQAIDWLNSLSAQSAIFDDAIEDFYFLGRCTKCEFSEVGIIGQLTVEFTCYPFMISKANAGDVIWDTFNFETDIMPVVNYDISELEYITVIWQSANVVIPTVSWTPTTTGNLTITQGIKSYIFTPGNNSNSSFVLKPGENALVMQGTGHVEFLFKQEVL